LHTSNYLIINDLVYYYLFKGVSDSNFIVHVFQVRGDDCMHVADYWVMPSLFSSNLETVIHPTSLSDLIIVLS